MNFNTFLSHQKILLKRIGFILVLLTITRLLFYIFNFSTFKPFDIGPVLKSFIFGIRFDFIAVFYFNILIIVLHLFCFKFSNNLRFQKILKSLFVFVNSILLLLNIIDVVFFQFSGKRSGWELVEMLNTSADTKEMLPLYITQYWYMILVFLGFIYLLIRYYPDFRLLNISKKFETTKYKILSYFLAIILFFSGFAFARGLETKPIRLITANRYVTPNYIPLLLNTPFTILNTINQHPENVKEYFTIKEGLRHFTSLHKPNNEGEFNKMNVVIIILESFGEEYMEAKTSQGKNFTPFLDSLRTVGLNCTNAFANATRSIDAIPPILGGFPSHLQTSFVGSAYSVNALRGLPHILKEEGYSTSFYHGGKNGTMGFDMFCKSVGIESYFGRTEYNNETDFDGAWGIWDEEFFQYMAKSLSHTNEPFLSVLYTLTSHEPYPIPEKYKDKFFPGEPKILRTIAYTDYALRRFFKTASTMKWFNNTLFVICPDHTSLVLKKKYKNSLAKMAIPIIYYCPSDNSLKGNMPKITQQLDIMPSVLDYLNYNRSYISYGKSIFESCYRFSVSYNDVNFQVIDPSYCMLFDGEKIIKVNRYNHDSLSLLKLPPNYQSKELKKTETHLKAYLQNYYFRLNNNLLADTIEIKDMPKKE